MSNNIKLKVAEAHQDDVNNGIVRIDSSIMRQLGVNVGDAIGISGERETVAIVDRAYPSDLGLEIIRMDGVIRKNAKLAVGEHAGVFKPELKEATKITITPLQEFVPHPTTIVSLKKGLLRKPIVSGDVITVGNRHEKRRGSISSSNPFAMELFSSIESDFLGFNLGSVKFKVTSSKPNGFLVIGPNTVVEISSKAEEDGVLDAINYEDVGGLKSQLVKVRELVELPLRHPEIFARLGISAPKGILLYGPPGTGKTLLARAIANETEASFFSISAPEVVNKYYGESEKKLRELFESAEKESPAIIFIDEIDAIASKREEAQGEVEKRIVAQLLTLMDGLNKNNKVIVVAATNRPDSLDEALRRPGRFDRELEIGVPKAEDRLEILKIHTRGMPLEVPKDFKVYEKALKEVGSGNKGSEIGDGRSETGDVRSEKGVEGSETGGEVKIDLKAIKDAFKEDVFKGLSAIPDPILAKVRHDWSESVLEDVANNTHGFVGADLSALVKEAAFNVLRVNFPDMKFGDDGEISKEILNKLEISKDDFAEALKVVRPSAMREFLVEVPNVKWTDIGGLENLKQQLLEMVEWPIKNADAFVRLGIKSPKGVLMYGPPGTGKTLLAKAVATETASNFIYIKGPEIINKYVGESEKMVRKLFQKARQNSPSILFFDEFDAIAGARRGGDSKASDTVVNQILTEMDGLEDLVNVKVIAATNRPGLIDPALLRPGRFDKLVLVDIPNLEAREKILNVHLKESPVDDVDGVVKSLASKTEGYVGADLEALVREAGMVALRRDIKSKVILSTDFDEALKVVKPSVNLEVSKKYKEIEQEMKKVSEDEVGSGLSMNSYI